jgi:hypothetical protein
MKNPKFKITKQDGVFVLRVVGTPMRSTHPNLRNTMKAIKIITRIYNNRDVNEKLKS